VARIEALSTPGTRQGNTAATDDGFHQHDDDVMLGTAEAARGHESEHHAQPVFSAGSEKLLDHAEGGICGHFQAILLRPGGFALGTDGAVVVRQSDRDPEASLGALFQLEVLELEAAELDLRSALRLTARPAKAELQ
jgi:hypothetical protein